jgi:DNA-binding NtrC family response regulator
MDFRLVFASGQVGLVGSRRGRGRYDSRVDSHPSAVLVAEDEPQLLRLMERLLARAGYEVVSARDGEQALSAIAAHRDRIGVAVLDAAIRPRGSREILERIATEGQGIGVVLTSGDVLEDGLHQLMRQRAGVFLRKPYTPKALLRAVEDALSEEGV